MSLENMAIVNTNNLPIKHVGDVHDGKVRSVYWLSEEDSQKLADMGYGSPLSEKAIMVISDKISAFDCHWKSESGLEGVPGKGAALNEISKYWFNRFEEEGLAGNHVVDTPHPLVWIVEKTQSISIEAIARQYITGSMWRAYEKGQTEFCGVQLPEGLEKNQKLDDLLITPTTKGVIEGVPGVEEKEDAKLTKQQIKENYAAFGFKSEEDVEVYEKLLREGFGLIGRELDSVGKILVDTKFEFGYVRTEEGPKIIYIDEVGTPDSSRFWDKAEYAGGNTVEESKEAFRQELLKSVPDSDVLLNPDRMDEREELAQNYRVPDSVFMNTSDVYRNIAEKITRQKVPEPQNARQEIVDSLNSYGLIE